MILTAMSICLVLNDEISQTEHRSLDAGGAIVLAIVVMVLFYGSILYGCFPR